MKVREVIEELKGFNPEAEFIVSSDEEMNSLFTKFGIADLENNKEVKDVVIYGYTGSEIPDSYFLNETQVFCACGNELKSDDYLYDNICEECR